MRISDWSSDVCSSDLPATSGGAVAQDPAAKAPPSMSRPLPPNRVREAPTIEYGCKADSDCAVKNVGNCCGAMPACVHKDSPVDPAAVQSQRSEEHTSELQSLMRISYAVFCLKTTNKKRTNTRTHK